jgi:hypothetical protein
MSRAIIHTLLTSSKHPVGIRRGWRHYHDGDSTKRRPPVSDSASDASHPTTMPSPQAAQATARPSLLFLARHRRRSCRRASIDHGVLFPAPLLQDLAARVAGDELALRPDAAKLATVAARHDRHRHVPPRGAGHCDLQVRTEARAGWRWSGIDRRGSLLHRRCV